MIITGRSGSAASKTRADIVIVLGRNSFMNAQDVIDCDAAAQVVIDNLDNRRATLVHQDSATGTVNRAQAFTTNAATLGTALSGVASTTYSTSDAVWGATLSNGAQDGYDQGFLVGSDTASTGPDGTFDRSRRCVVYIASADNFNSSGATETSVNTGIAGEHGLYGNPLNCSLVLVTIDTLSSRHSAVETTFATFNGYNNPEVEVQHYSSGETSFTALGDYILNNIP